MLQIVWKRSLETLIARKVHCRKLERWRSMGMLLQYFRKPDDQSSAGIADLVEERWY